MGHRIAHTMSRFRLLFTWLLIAAVPMQAFAAASMLFCGMGAQHQHSAQTSKPHDHAAMQSHSGDADHGYFQAADPNPDATTPDVGHTCGICAACCSGAALVGVGYMAAMAPAHQTASAEPFVLIYTRPSPVPEKPPRA